MRERQERRPSARAGTRAPRYEHVLPHEADLRGRGPEVERLSTRLRTGAPGVVALLGIGGAGKTVLLQQVLAAAQDGVDGLFVWSFYREPDADRFLAEAYRYVTGRASPAEGSLGHAYALCEALATAGRVVLALDGLERLQVVGEDTAGRVEDPALRVFLERLAAGVGKAVVIATSRVGLRDLQTRAGYLAVPLDALPPEAGAALLADRGVKGTDAERQALATALGGHPLTLTLFGGLVAEHAGALPSRAGELLDVKAFAAATPSERLDRVLNLLDGRLGKLECAMLERMSVFRGEVTADLVVKVLLQPAPSATLVTRFRTWWSDPLGRLDAAGLLHALEHLEALHILHREGERDGKVIYAFHAAVKDHFYERLLAGGDAARVHEAVRVHLEAKPLRRKPESDEELDRMEELVFHTLRCGRAEDAFRIYWERMEGYEHLGRGLGAYTRGRRLVAAFFVEGDPAKPVEGLPPWRGAMLAGDLGLYLEKLGELDAALACHLDIHEASRAQKDLANQAVALLNQAAILLHQGLLPDARRVAAKAQHHAEQAADESLRADALTLVGQADALLGKSAHALASFTEARRVVCTLDGADHELFRRRGIRHAQALLRVGKPADALRVLEANGLECRRRGWKQDLALCEALLADARAANRDLAGAERAWQQAHAFGLASGSQEVLALASIAGARLARAKGDPVAAGAHVEEGLAITKRVGFGVWTIDLLLLAGDVLADAKDPRARELAREALALASHAPCAYVLAQAEARALAARV